MARIPTVSKQDAERAYESAQKVVETHRRISAWLEPGQTLAQIDRFIGQTLADLGCRSCFLDYKVPKTPPFPSHACLSVNDCVVHGTSGYYEEPMREGDVLKIDVGVTFRGWIGDAAWTYAFGKPSDEVRRLMDAGKRSIAEGIRELRPGNRYIDFARVVHRIVEVEMGLHLIRGLGGHGYGRKLHCPPFVANMPPTYPGEWPDADLPCQPDTLVAVEPMIASGTGRIAQRPGTWPIFTADGSQSVHYEHDVLITEDGPRILTHGLESLRDVIA